MKTDTRLGIERFRIFAFPQFGAPRLEERQHYVDCRRKSKTKYVTAKPRTLN